MAATLQPMTHSTTNSTSAKMSHLAAKQFHMQHSGTASSREMGFMTPSDYMQISPASEEKSRSRLEKYKDDKTTSEPESTTTTTTAQKDSKDQKPAPIVQRHDKVTALIRLSKQALDEGGVPGSTYPYLPKGPSLFRPETEDYEARRSRSPSPLSKEARLPIPDTTSPVLHTKSTASHTKSSGSRNRPTTATTPTRMPHAVTIPNTGFQALILCGPGIGLNTFTSVPQDFPKALVTLANRPIIWYVLDWCYRMGVTDITIITPPTSKGPISSALAQNPHLTSLPSPRPDILAPAELEFNTPTAELLRLPEVQDVIKSDFVLLPCDLVCDIGGETFIETYLTSVAALGGTGTDTNGTASNQKQAFNLGAAGSGRRGGLSVWYNTANREESVKKEECDFMATVNLRSQHKIVQHPQTESSPARLRQLAWTTPMSELLEEAEEDKAVKVRQSLLRKHGSVKCMTQYRDSHIYFLPYWVKEFARINDDLESFSEDLIGTWAKADWRKASYRARFGAGKIFEKVTKRDETADDRNQISRPVEEEIDLLSLSSTQVTRHQPNTTPLSKTKTAQLASRVQAKPEDSMISAGSKEDDEEATDDAVPILPPVLSYILSSDPKAPLVRRVDTTPLLLSVSLALAKLPSLEEDAKNSKPFSHSSKIHSTVTVPPKCTISRSDTLIDANVTLSPQCVIRGSCIGASVQIGQGARITNCVIMEGATIGEKVVLTGAVVGKKAVIGKGVTLKEGSEVQDGMVIPEGTEGAKGEKFLVGGFEDDEDGDLYGDGEDDDDADDD